MRFILLFIFIVSLSSAQAQVITWQGPESMVSTKYYRVKVNGVSVPVYDTPIASYAVFDFTGEVRVDVETMYDVRWVDIRPLVSKVKPAYTGDHSFSFSLNKPQNLSVELNGRIRQQPLFIFSNKPEREKPSRKDKNVVWFEGGKLHENVRLELKDNQTVYIEGGAVVQGVIYARGKKNIKIMGRGIMDGSKNQQQVGERIRFIDFRDCENMRVQDIVLQNATTWQIAAFHTNKLEINGVRIVSEHGGDDGMDIVRCTNVVVDGVFAHTKDDCIAIKSHGNYPGNHPTDNILVKNCIFWNSLWGNAVEVGFELFSDEVKNIRFENIDIIHVEDGAALSIHNAGPAHVSNVVFENIRLEDVRQKLFDVAIFFSRWSPEGINDPEFHGNKHYLSGAWDGVQKIPAGTEEKHLPFRGRISNIVFKDIHILEGNFPFSVFHGFDENHMVDGVVIENLTVHGKKITDIEGAKLRLHQTKNLVVK